MTGLLSTILADWHHDGSGWWVLFPLFWLVVLGTLVYLVRTRGPWGPPRRETAVDVLERRFAQGEIDENEYRERRAVLGGEQRG